MVDINSPLGRQRMAAQAQRETYTVDDASDPEYMEEPQTRSSRKAQRRAAQQQMRLDDRMESGREEQREARREPQYYEAPAEEPQGFMGAEESLSYREMILGAKDRLSPEAKKRLEAITGLGSVKGVCEIEGMSFSFKSLKTKERMEVFQELFKGSDQDSISLSYKQRINILGRALTHVDGQPVEYILGTRDPNARVVLFLEQEDPVTDFIWEWYNKNIEKVAKANLSPQEVEEVVEDIKKS